MQGKIFNDAMCKAIATLSQALAIRLAFKRLLFLRALGVLGGKALVLLLVAAAPAFAAGQADLILHNGKIVTVDDYFTVAQAVAIKGERVTVSYTHLRAHETRHDLVCRLL